MFATDLADAVLDLIISIKEIFNPDDSCKDVDAIQDCKEAAVTWGANETKIAELCNDLNDDNVVTMEYFGECEGHRNWAIMLLVGTILGKILSGMFGVLYEYIDEPDQEMSYFIVELTIIFLQDLPAFTFLTTKIESRFGNPRRGTNVERRMGKHSSNCDLWRSFYNPNSVQLSNHHQRTSSVHIPLCGVMVCTHRGIGFATHLSRRNLLLLVRL